MAVVDPSFFSATNVAAVLLIDFDLVIIINYTLVEPSYTHTTPVLVRCMTVKKKKNSEF